MSTFDDFDLDKVAALAKAVAALETSATTVSTKIVSTNYNADYYVNLGYGVSPQLTRANPYTSDSADPDRAGLRAVALAAPGVSAEITRRLAHLTACQKIVLDGYPIDADVVFDDEPPPDEQKVKDALGKIPGDLDKWFDGVSDDDLVNTLSGLNAAEVDAVIGSLSDADLQKMGMAVSLKDTPNIAGIPYGMSNDQRGKLANCPGSPRSSPCSHRSTSTVRAALPARRSAARCTGRAARRPSRTSTRVMPGTAGSWPRSAPSCRRTRTSSTTTSRRTRTARTR